MLAQPLFQSLVLAIPEAVSKTRFSSYLRQSLQFDYASQESRERLRQKRLSTIVQAAEKTPMYESLLTTKPGASSGSNSGNLQSQVVTKKDFRRFYPTGVFSKSPEKDWQYLSTSGTTDRLSVVADFVKRDHRRSSELRTLSIAVGGAIGIATMEIPPNVCNVVCGLDDAPEHSIWNHLWQSLRDRNFSNKSLSDLRGLIERNLLLRKLTLPPIDPAPAATLVKQLDACLRKIKQEKSIILRGYPHYLMWLADRARLTNVILPHVRYVLPYGGLASPCMIARIESGFRAAFRNVYGTSELGAMAASCGRSSGMHVFEDLFLMKIVHGETSSQCQTGPLVITDLINDAMPILRYQVGDVARFLQGDCTCGRKTSRIEILGRIQEVLEFEGRKIYSREVADTFYADPGIANARLEEVAAGCFEAMVVPTPNGPDPDLSAWQERFRTLVKLGVKRIKCRIVPTLRPETSGKYLLVWPYTSST